VLCLLFKKNGEKACGALVGMAIGPKPSGHPQKIPMMGG